MNEKKGKVMEMEPSNKIVLTEAEKKVAAEAMKGGNKSAAIRELLAKGWQRGRVAKAVGVSYQRVYNTEGRAKAKKGGK